MGSEEKQELFSNNKESKYMVSSSFRQLTKMTQLRSFFEGIILMLGKRSNTASKSLKRQLMFTITKIVSEADMQLFLLETIIFKLEKGSQKQRSYIKMARTSKPELFIKPCPIKGIKSLRKVSGFEDGKVKCFYLIENAEGYKSWLTEQAMETFQNPQYLKGKETTAVQIGGEKLHLLYHCLDIELKDIRQEQHFRCELFSFRCASSDLRFAIMKVWREQSDLSNRTRTSNERTLEALGSYEISGEVERSQGAQDFCLRECVVDKTLGSIGPSEALSGEKKAEN